MNHVQSLRVKVFLFYTYRRGKLLSEPKSTKKARKQDTDEFYQKVVSLIIRNSSIRNVQRPIVLSYSLNLEQKTALRASGVNALLTQNASSVSTAALLFKQGHCMIDI